MGSVYVRQRSGCDWLVWNAGGRWRCRADGADSQQPWRRCSVQSGSSCCARTRAVGRVEAPAALFPAEAQKVSRETAQAQTGRGWAVEGVWGVKSTGRQRWWWCTLAAAFLECCSPGAVCLSLACDGVVRNKSKGRCNQVPFEAAVVVVVGASFSCVLRAVVWGEVSLFFKPPTTLDESQRPTRRPDHTSGS